MAETELVQPPRVTALALLQSRTVYVYISSHCSPRSLLRFRQVNRAARQAVQDYMVRTFDISKRLERFFCNPTVFRSLQARTATVISGSFALQFFDRTYYPESELDVYVHPDRSVLDVGLYLESEGYALLPCSWQLENWHDEVERLCQTMHDPMDALYVMQGTRAVYTFVRPPTPAAPAAPIRKIQIIVSRSSPFRALLDFHSTSILNIVTYNAAYSLYPQATLEEYRSLVLNGGDQGKAAALEKYSRHGWQAIPNPSPLIQQLDHSLLHIGKSRWVCDEHTWTIPLSMEGVEPPKPASPTSPVLSWDPIVECGWKFVHSSTPRSRLVVVEFSVVRSTILRWRYTTGHKGYLRQLIAFFITQGSLQHMLKRLDEEAPAVEELADTWTW
ncbi:hypothetical protein C8Q73DRAFT_664433 [Cubamyces lactineus]|nr:hypothetical protein C8Q73DRAFT_664433 [Cubamyces lactineus]